MFTAMLLVAMHTGVETPDWGRHGCYGCYSSCGCWGGGWGGCWGGGWRGGWCGCSGYGWGGCYGGGWGCYGGGWGCYGGYASYGCSGYGGYASYGCSGYGGYASYAAPMYSGCSTPVIAGCGATVTGTAYGGGMALGTAPIQGTAMASQPISTSNPNEATLVVQLPADAQLNIGNHHTQSTSAVRTFTTPPLTPGKDYCYTLNASIVRNGQTLKATREVPVHPGQVARVAFDPNQFTATTATR